MKHSLWISGLFFVLFAALPTVGYPAIAKPAQTALSTKKQTAHEAGKQVKRLSFREKIGGKISKFQQKIRRWKEGVQLAFPSGKLLTSLVFLVLSIIFFAVGGVTTLGALFNILGSVAVIVALLFFVLWMTEKASNLPKPTDD